MAVELRDVMLIVNSALDRLLRETETAMVELGKWMIMQQESNWPSLSNSWTYNFDW